MDKKCIAQRQHSESGKSKTSNHSYTEPSRSTVFDSINHLISLQRSQRASLIFIYHVNSQDFDNPENLSVSQDPSLISQIVDINWRTSGLPRQFIWYLLKLNLLLV